MINEEEVYNKLKKYNFEYIQLEDYNMYEKIKLFMESEVILSSNSGALTLLLFANIKTKIIEIINTGENTKHYYDISTILGLNYNRYSNINEDDNVNFILDYNEFEKYLINIL
jgi:capsular polysaccharide biosynthesis protein